MTIYDVVCIGIGGIIGGSIGFFIAFKYITPWILDKFFDIKY